MPVVHRSLFGGTYFIYLKQHSQKLHPFETKQPKKAVPGGPTLCPALGVWSSSPGRLSVVQLLHTDNCSWPAPKGYQAFNFQTSYLHKCLSAFIFQERKKKKSCIGKSWNKCYNYFSSRNNFHHFKFLACGDLFHVHVAIFNFFIGPCNRRSITQSCKSPNRTETLYIWLMSYGINIHIPTKG